MSKHIDSIPEAENRDENQNAMHITNFRAQQ